MKIYERYFIAFTIVTVVGYVVGQIFTSDDREFEMEQDSSGRTQDQSDFNYYKANDGSENYDDDFERGSDFQSEGYEKRNRRHPPEKFEHQSLCLTITKTVSLSEEDPNNEYYPTDHYNDTRCLKPFMPVHGPYNSRMRAENVICGPKGFDCVTRSMDIPFMRRPRGSNCWQPLVKKVHYGCECLWPQYHHGMSIHEHINILHHKSKH